MPDDTLGTYGHRLERIADDLAGKAMRAQLDAVGVGAKRDAMQALRGDLGDEDMSNWPRRGKTAKLTVRYEHKSDTSIEVSPTGRARGAWRILEDGRQASAKGDAYTKGKARKDGTRKQYARKRTSGATAAKNTWSEAVDAIERNTPRRVNDAVGDILRKRL
jgi:hypothetical protein